MASADKQYDDSYDLEENSEWEMVGVSPAKNLEVFEIKVTKLPLHSKIVIIGEYASGKSQLAKKITQNWLSQQPAEFFLLDNKSKSGYCPDANRYLNRIVH